MVQSQISRIIWPLALAAFAFLSLWVFLFKDALFQEPDFFESSLGESVEDVRLWSQEGEEKPLYRVVDEVIQKEDTQHVLISFWATWCAPCIKELPMLEERRLDYTQRGMSFLLINFDNAFRDRDRDEVKEWLDSHLITMQTFYDPQDKLIQHLKVPALPFNMLIDKDKKIVWAEMGLLKFSDIEKKFLYRPKN